MSEIPGHTKEAILYPLGEWAQTEIDKRDTRIAALEAENAKLLEYASFVALACTKRGLPGIGRKLTDEERVGMIRSHPVTQAALR